MLLFLGTHDDPHLLAVRDAAQQLGAAAAIFDPLSEPATCHIEYFITTERASARFHSFGIPVEADTVTGVWWRLKPHFDASRDSAEALRVRRFTEREWQHTLEPLEFILSHARWLNTRETERRVRFKPFQLLIARQHGFSVPPTLISNHPDRVARFLRDECNDESIYKALSWYFEPPNKLVFTTPFHSESALADRASVAAAPGIYQSNIPKQFELRVTVVGTTVFAVRIDSQATNGAEQDWRLAIGDVTYTLFELPASVLQRLLRLHHSFGLAYGAYDFIVDASGEYIFLEVNPLGQWLWLEHALGLPISLEVARFLVNATEAPNQALQRTAPAVTLAAPPPAPAQPSRQPPPSLSLGSLGQTTTKQQCKQQCKLKSQT